MANTTMRLDDNTLNNLKNTLVVRVSDGPQGKGSVKAVIGWGLVVGGQKYDDMEAQSLGTLLHMIADQVQEGSAAGLETVYIVYQK